MKTMPLEITCTSIGLVVHRIVREIRKSLRFLIENKSVKVFIATHKMLFIFVDDVLDKNFAVRNLVKIINKYNIQCSMRSIEMLKPSKLSS